MQVLRNFVANALRFTQEGSVEVRAEAEGAWVRFAVRDTGVGIAAEDLERIFEEFEQVGSGPVRGGRGTGLGLALCRRLAGVLGGEVGVESTPGTGSTFWLRLPAHHAGLVPGSGPVLVVDDDEAARYVVASLLRPLGWAIVEAAGGTEALLALRGAPPALVVLDLQMPEVDGERVLVELRRDPRTAHVPVVVHSSRVLDAPGRARLEALQASVLDKSRTSRDALLRAMTSAAEKVAA